MTSDGTWACPICARSVDAGRKVCPGCGLDEATARSLSSGVERAAEAKPVEVKSGGHACIICGGESASEDGICASCRESVGSELGDIDFCRGCGSEMSKSHTHCPACGLCKDKEEEVCPNCGAPRDGCANKCHSCGEMLGEKVTEASVRALETSARGALEKARALGMRVLGAEQDLQAASLMLQAGDVEGACHMMKSCDDRLADMLQQFEVYEGTLKRAKAKLEKAKADGIPFGGAQAEISEAERLGGRKEFKEAIPFALKASEDIDRGYANSRGNLVEMGRWKK